MNYFETTLTFRRLRPDAPVGLRAKSCLELHPRRVMCTRCREACPVEVLRVTEAGMELVDGCLGCGRCMAVCPTGAIAVHGFSLTLAPESTLEALTLDCWNVPREFSPPGAVRVPCLGGLSASQLLALRYVAGNRPLVLLDRGWCGECAARKNGPHPALAVVSATRDWLRQIGAPATHWPTLTRKPLPLSSQRRTLSDENGAGATVSHGDFVSRLKREVAATVHEVAAFHLTDSGARIPVRAVNCLTPVRAIERERLWLILDRLAARYGGPFPESFFPVVEIGSACRGHRLCANLCPTGALSPNEYPNGGGVMFERTVCIACGQCERVCPEHAVRLSHQDAAAASRQEIMEPPSNARCACMDCGDIPDHREGHTSGGKSNRKI